MRIGLRQAGLRPRPGERAQTVDDAQTLAEEALTELRHVVRAIHPPILTDRGWSAGCALAASSGLDVTVTVTA